MNPLETRALYDLSHTLAAPLLEKVRYPWEALSGIGAFIAALGPTLSQEEYASPRPGVCIGGPIGMLLSVPIASAAYTLLREATKNRERQQFALQAAGSEKKDP